VIGGTIGMPRATLVTPVPMPLLATYYF